MQAAKRIADVCFTQERVKTESIPSLQLPNLPLYDLDDEMAELLFKTVQKLEGMTDAEFDEYYIVPDSLFED